MAAPSLVYEDTPSLRETRAKAGLSSGTPRWPMPVPGGVQPAA